MARNISISQLQCDHRRTYRWTHPFIGEEKEEEEEKEEQEEEGDVEEKEKGEIGVKEMVAEGKEDDQEEDASER